MTVQFITTPGGDEMAILPRADFEALVEELEDRIDNEAASRADARRAAGEEIFPGDLISALIDGANPVRSFRSYRGVSATELARRAGISGSYLSQIESGTREGTGATLRKLAAALNVDVDLLLSTDGRSAQDAA